MSRRPEAGDFGELDERGGRDELDVVSLEFRQEPGKCRTSARVGMSYSQGDALYFHLAAKFLQLAQGIGDRRCVVEKNRTIKCC